MHPGTAIEIENKPEGVILKVSGEGISLIRKQGILVHHSGDKTDLDMANSSKKNVSGAASILLRRVHLNESFFCLVAALVDQLTNHSACFEVFRGYTMQGNQGYCSTHGLAEFYAVVTALRQPRKPAVRKFIPATPIISVLSAWRISRSRLRESRRSTGTAER